MTVIGNARLRIGAERDVQRRLRDEPALVPSAIEGCTTFVRLGVSHLPVRLRRS